MTETILITGGCGGLGAIVAGHLAAKGPVNLILNGRSPLGERQRSQLAALEQHNCNPFYLEADVSDASALRRGLAEARARFGPIDGVIHAAGLAGRKLFEQPPGEFQKFLDPKVRGVQVLDEVLAGEPLRFVCYFSSTSAVLGDFGACNYAVGNRFMIAYARHRNALWEQGQRQGRTIVINWPLWRDGGMGFGDDRVAARYLNASGQRMLETREGLALLDRFLGAQQESTQPLVFAGRPDRICRFLGVETAEQETAQIADAPAAGSDSSDSSGKNGLGRAAHMHGWPLENCLAWDLREMITALLKVPGDRLDETTQLTDFGFDSIGLVHYARALSERYGLAITPDLFFAHSTLEQLEHYFLTEHGPVMARCYREEHEEHRGEQREQRDHRQEQRPVPASTIRAEAPSNTSEPIAIIGMSGRFPKARTVDELWKLLAEGINAVDRIPADRFDWPAYGGSLGEGADRPLPQWAGMISGVAEFDPQFFELSPREANSMDPRQRLLLQEAWNALENAAYGPRQIERQRMGMFVGVEEGDYHRLGEEYSVDLDKESSIASNHTGILAARLAYFLDFKGPVMAINTACSSALVAVHQACQSLYSDECDTALAAGVNLLLTPGPLLDMARAGMLSPDGECRPFDKRANGLVPGEAVAVVVLKRLSRALADGDPIHAMLLGSGINHDGRTNGITAPNRLSQTELIRRVHAKSGIEAAHIGYIIAHGTGTSLGDPVEVNALNDAFQGAPARDACALTSTKSNLGHTFAASGLVSLLCMVQALRHRTIPASLHCEEENDFIQWGKGPFFVNKANRPWQVGAGERRRGAVSAFGISGTNAHVVLEEFDGEPVTGAGDGTEPPYHLLVLSAKTAAALTENARSLGRALGDETLARRGLAAIGYTLLEGRTHFRHRCALVVTSIDDAREQLNRFGEGKRRTLFEGVVPREFSEQKVVANHIAELLQRSPDLIRDPSSYRDILLGLGEFYCRGYHIDGEMLAGGPRRRISLPAYAFARGHYWQTRGTGAERRTAREENREVNVAPEAIGTASFEPIWLASPLPETAEELDFAERIQWVCRANESSIREFSVDERSTDVHSTDEFDAQTPCERYEAIALQVFERLQGILSRKPEAEILLQLVVCGEGDDSPLTNLTGLLRTAQWENPALVAQLIHVEGSPSRRRLADILAENRRASRDRQIRYRQGQREVMRWVPLENGPVDAEDGRIPWRHNGVYLITGGSGELARLLANDISASAPQARLILCGRSAPDARMEARLAAGQGYRQADMSRREDVEKLIADIESRYGRLTGVIHCAGIVEDGFIVNKTSRQFRAVLSPKVAGTEWLDGATRDMDLDFFLLFSSSTGALGNPGQADYAAANGFMDAFADYRNRLVAAGVRRGHTLSINWPLWREGGMRVEAGRLEILRRDNGIAPLETAAGMGALRRALTGRRARVMVLAGEVSRLPSILQLPQSQNAQPRHRSPEAQTPPPSNREGVNGQRMTRAAAGSLLMREIRQQLLIGDEQPLDAEATFTELGLDSIQSLRLMRALSAKFDRPLRETLVFDYPNIAALAEYLSGQEIEKPRPLPRPLSAEPQPADFKTHLAALRQRYDEIVPLQIEGDGPLLFCIHPMSGDVGIYTKLAEFAARRFRVIGIRSRGLLSGQEPLATVETMGRHYAGILAALEPGRPKHLIGASMGGAAAYETARQLQLQGESVHTLFLVEAPLIETDEDAALWASDWVENHVMNANFLLIALLHLEADFRARKAAGYIQWSDLEIRRDELESPGEARSNGQQLWGHGEESLVERLVSLIKGRGVTPEKPYLKQRLQSMAAIHSANLRALQGYRASPRSAERAQLPRVPRAFFLRSRSGQAVSTGVYNPDYLVRVQRAKGGLLPFFEPWQALLPGMTTFEAEGGNHFDLLSSDAAVERMAERIAAILAAPVEILDAPPEVAKLPTKTPALKRPEPDEHGGEAIAIIGMSGRFPGAETLEQFYDLLKSDRCALAPLPSTRGWDLPTVEVNQGGFLPDIEKFDPLFFNIPPNEAALADPAERLFLQESWKAIEDAGVDPLSLAGKNWGVFCGGGGDYTLRIQAHSGVSPHVTTSAIPGRVSYSLNLAGPCLSVDAGCASSLLALAQACDYLTLGRCEVALAGGVLIQSTANLIHAAWRSGTLSRDGQCLALDQRAGGMAVGEGVCAVVLKPLRAALADGDRIHAVIEAWGHNHNGKTNGMAAPSGKAQTALISDIYRRFRIQPETIGLVEANATGTPLGDTVEIQALVDAFRRYTDKRAYCALGTVENHIGHAYQCSGMAHLMKAVLALKHGEIPGTLRAEQPSAALEPESSPFYIHRHAMPWPAPNGAPRRAAVNSFGSTGANVHMVVAEAVMPPAAPDATNGPVLIALSAKTQSALTQRCRELLAFLEHRQVNLGQLSANLLLRRSHFTEHRCALVVSTRDELLAQLAYLAGDTAARGGEAPATGHSELYALAAQYRSGGAIDLERHFLVQEKVPLSLPGYPFEKRHCWMESGLEAGRAEQPASSRTIIQRLIQDISGYRAEEMDPTSPLSRYGLDSLMSMRLLALINERFGLALQLADLTANDSLNALARLADREGAIPREPQQRIGAPRPEAAEKEFTQQTRWFFERLQALPEALHVIRRVRRDADGDRDPQSATAVADGLTPQDWLMPEDWLMHCRPALTYLLERGIAVFNSSSHSYFVAHRSIDVAAEIERLDVPARESLLRHCPMGVLIAPVSQEQERNLYHSEVMQQSAWNIHHVYQSSLDDLDVSLLESALVSLIRRHDLLRTRYVQSGPSSWAQLVEAEGRPVFQVVEMPSPEAFQRFILERKNRLLQLGELPLFHLWLTKTAGHWYFGFVTHHSLADAFTTTLLFTDLMRRYTALAKREIPLDEPLGEEYWHYTLGQFDPQRCADEETAQFWRQRLSAATVAMKLPYNRPPDDVDERVLRIAENRVITLPDRLNQAIDHVHRAHGITFTHLFSAAIALALVEGMGNEKALIQYINNQRDRASLLNTPGEFTNMLFVPFEMSAFSNAGSAGAPAWPGATVLQFLLGMKRQTLACLRHAKIAFSDLLALTGLENYEGYYRQRGDVVIDSADIDTATLKQTQAHGSSRYADGFDREGRAVEGPALATLLFQLLRVNGRIHLVTSYRKALFDTSELHRLASMIVDIVEHMVENPDRPCSQMLAHFQAPLQRLRERSLRSVGAPPFARPSRSSSKPPVFAECQALNRVEQGRPVFWIHAGGLGGVEAYRTIARDVPRLFYGIQARGWMTEHHPLRGVEAMAAYYAHIIKSVQPHGPYDLGGYSLGGMLGYEVARQLQASGDDVASLVMVDSYDVVDTEPGPHFNKKNMLGAVNLSLQALAAEPKRADEYLIHRDELDCDADDHGFWSQLMMLAGKRGMTKPEGQLRELVRQMIKFGRSLMGDPYSIPPLIAPRSVRCHYVRNQSGTFYGQLEPHFTLPGTNKLYVDGMNYWRTWEERLPILEIMDVESSNHISLLSERCSAEAISGVCRGLYAIS
ncbi:SDR family NAD(P)-dependent oxidoreductase [Pendulispora rubella]|uniref:SDR family NAD(P)-dependent oxidoreductase n=1 Tax=Pendulispora rubella TaxID=2741070 RepID=A0ABZ2KVF6_9BACT